MDETNRRDEQESPGGSGRRCSFCQREAREGLLLCPFCGRRISPRNEPQTKWYHSKYAVAVSVATLGPFALPMIWSHPSYKTVTKIVLTALILALTALLIYVLVIVLARLMGQIRQVMTL